MDREALAKILVKSVKEAASLHEMYAPYVDKDSGLHRVRIDGDIDFLALADAAIAAMTDKR